MLQVLCAARQTPAGSMPGWHPARVPRSWGGTQMSLFQPQTSRQHPCLMLEQQNTACTACGVSTLRGTGAPSPPAHARRPRPGPAHSSSSVAQGSCFPRTPQPEPAGTWVCTSGPAVSGPWPAMGVSAPSLPPPQVGLDGVGRSHGCDEANGVCQPEGDVLWGPGEQEQGVRPTAPAQGPAGWGSTQGGRAPSLTGSEPPRPQPRRGAGKPCTPVLSSGTLWRHRAPRAGSPQG